MWVGLYDNINVKKLWFTHELTAHDTSKTAKITDYVNLAIRAC